MRKIGPMFVVLLLLFGFLLMIEFVMGEFSKPPIDAHSYTSVTEFMDLADSGNVTDVEIKESVVIWMSRGGKLYSLEVNPQVVNNLEFINRLRAKGIRVTVRAPDRPSVWAPMMPMLIMFGIAGIIFLIIISKAAGSGGPLSKLGEMTSSKAKISMPGDKKITFADVAGCDEAKLEVMEIVEFLKNPDKFKKVGARIPKGVLLIGPPGCGKTLLAKAVAGEADVPFFSDSGAGFVEIFVGMGSARVRDLFDKAEVNAPCIVFIDELDAVGRKRNGGFVTGGHEEREQTLDQILVRMDGFSESDKPVIVVGATNRPDILDPALVRAGRFDRKISVDLPDVKGREEILNVHAKTRKLCDDVDLKEVAKQTTLFSGADLATLVNEAALLAGREEKEEISMEHFREARDRTIGGLKKRNSMTEKEKLIVAHHESGHTIVQKTLKNTDPVDKVTIIPRGMSLGATYGIPKEDRRLYFKEYLLDLIAVLLSGRIAEELLEQGVTSGASNDFERATDVARRMVTEFGMSEEMGLICYNPRTESDMFLGGSFGGKNYSPETHKRIDDEVKEIVDGQYAVARKILEDKKALLNRMAAALLEKETLQSAEIDAMMNE